MPRLEATLQLRLVPDEVIQWAISKIKSDERAEILKVKKLKGGADIQMSSQKYAQSLGKMLKERFPGVLEVTARLHTQDKMTSKKVYRVTVLFKYIPFKRGDKIVVRDEELEILSIGDPVRVKTKTGEKKMVSLEDVLRER